jgi:hypothetical protein
MGDIAITVSEKEFKLLLKHIELANWMLDAYKTETDDESRENEAFYHKMLALAHENGVADGIVYDENLHDFFITDEKEQEYHRYIDSYNDEVFWDILEEELATKDFLEKHGKKALAEMDSKKQYALLGKEMEKYNQEFTKHGLKNLRVVK